MFHQECQGMLAHSYQDLLTGQHLLAISAIFVPKYGWFHSYLFQPASSLSSQPSFIKNTYGGLKTHTHTHTRSALFGFGFNWSSIEPGIRILSKPVQLLTTCSLD